jgi:hypothetical protein
MNARLVPLIAGLVVILGVSCYELGAFIGVMITVVIVALAVMIVLNTHTFE